MSSCDRKHPLACQNVFREPLRAGNVAVTPIQYRLDQWIASAYYVPDQPEIGIQGDLIGAVTLGELNTLAGKLDAHRRVNIGVTACHPVPRCLGDRSNASHESTADPENVDMHEAWCPERPGLRAHEKPGLQAKP